MQLLAFEQLVGLVLRCFSLLDVLRRQLHLCSRVLGAAIN
jgi:hypothetical protein